LVSTSQKKCVCPFCDIELCDPEKWGRIRCIDQKCYGFVADIKKVHCWSTDIAYLWTVLEEGGAKLGKGFTI